MRAKVKRLEEESGRRLRTRPVPVAASHDEDDEDDDEDYEEDNNKDSSEEEEEEEEDISEFTETPRRQ